MRPPASTAPFRWLYLFNAATLVTIGYQLLEHEAGVWLYVFAFASGWILMNMIQAVKRLEPPA